MASVVWSPGARDNLRRILAVITRESSARVAAKWGTRFRAAVAALETFPRIGSPVEEIPQADLREQIVGPYRIMYAHSDDTCRILAVFHGARDITGVLDPENLP